MGKIKDLTNMTFGRLTVLKLSEKKGNLTAWECVCRHESHEDKIVVVVGAELTRGRTKSCGCIRKEMMTKHGMYKERIYAEWRSMKSRCNYTENSKGHIYYSYLAKGITVCSEWLCPVNGFTNFYNWAMSNGYADNLEIDRKNNSKGYSPDNCRWVTETVQSFNKDIPKNNTSGYIGVISNTKQGKPWIARFQLKNKIKQIGTFNTALEAHKARQAYIKENYPDLYNPNLD